LPITRLFFFSTPLPGDRQPPLLSFFPHRPGCQPTESCRSFGTSGHRPQQVYFFPFLPSLSMTLPLASSTASNPIDVLLLAGRRHFSSERTCFRPPPHHKSTLQRWHFFSFFSLPRTPPPHVTVVIAVSRSSPFRNFSKEFDSRAHLRVTFYLLFQPMNFHLWMLAYFVGIRPS